MANANEEIFVAGIDVARGGQSARVGGGSGDDFAMTTMKATATGPAYWVKTIRYNGAGADAMSGLIYREEEAFGYNLMMMDAGGGGLFVRDEMRMPTQNYDDRDRSVIPILTLDDPLIAAGDDGSGRSIAKNILSLFSRGDERVKSVVGKMPSDSALINKAHDLLRGAIENRRLVIPPRWKGWEDLGIAAMIKSKKPDGLTGRQMEYDPGRMRKVLNDAGGLSEADLAHAEIDLAVLQLLQVDRAKDKEGSPKLDSHNMFQFTSSQHKDAAYSAVYAYFALWLWRELLRLDALDAPQESIRMIVQEV